ncbi:LOW QUALITY PROTEIN: reverse transcriptase [Phytophthora megakarya]|uniref:Reverse transcriptase n=1 Tax=Phytophthora megakarya TaxID=4795 RepID=A0A225WZ80_9STRA|nr:LOW QUALITY PROTEIN: reverse transcriptase [Phytophthora megakarya]
MEVKGPLVPAVERPEYETPRAILQRPKATLIQCRKVEASQDHQDIPDCLPSDESPSDKSPSDKSSSEIRPLDLASVASEESDLSSIADEDPISHAITVEEALEDLDQVTWATDPSSDETTDVVETRGEDDRDEIGVVNQDQLHLRGQDQGTSPSKCGGLDLPSMMSVQSGTGHVTGDPSNGKCAASMSQKTDMDPSPVVEDQPGTLDLDLTWDSDKDYDECVYYHEGSDLYAEDVDGQMAGLPEVPVTTEDVKIEDIQLCGSDNQTSEEIDRLRQRIWKFRHLLIGKGNALPPHSAIHLGEKTCSFTSPQMEYAKKISDLEKLAVEVSPHPYRLVEKQYWIAMDRKTRYEIRKIHPTMFALTGVSDAEALHHVDTTLSYACKLN